MSQGLNAQISNSGIASAGVTNSKLGRSHHSEHHHTATKPSHPKAQDILETMLQLHELLKTEDIDFEDAMYEFDCIREYVEFLTMYYLDKNDKSTATEILECWKQIVESIKKMAEV